MHTKRIASNRFLEPQEWPWLFKTAASLVLSSPQNSEQDHLESHLRWMSRLTLNRGRHQQTSLTRLRKSIQTWMLEHWHYNLIKSWIQAALRYVALSRSRRQGRLESNNDKENGCNELLQSSRVFLSIISTPTLLTALIHIHNNCESVIV